MEEVKMTQKTTEGYVWTPRSGLQRGGLPCKGVISPPSRVRAPKDHVYDVIIVGGGYAGLSAARDLTTTGHSVLLLEARDRIGGRTYTVDVDGYAYEMGGTWVSHWQPNTFREMKRYNLDEDLVQTRQHGHKNDYYTINVPDATPRRLSHDEAGQMAAKGWNLFVDVDGESCRKICPLPHQQLGNVKVNRADVEKYDKYSCWDRYQEIKDQLNAEESGLLLSLLLHISGGNLQNSGMWEMIRSHALGGHTFDNFEDIWLLYKLREGQSTLALRMFEEAVSHGLEYSLKTPVTTISEVFVGSHKLVQVMTSDDRVLRAYKVISTIPLNVLKHINFNPPLSRKRQAAVEEGHICFINKIHAEVKGSDMASWNGMCYPNILLYGYGDGVLPNGNTHLVAFGTDERSHFVPERDPEKVVEAFQKLHPVEVQKTIFHNWNTDPYSQAGPCFWPPEFMSRYQDELQSRHGNIFFASADWAHGWRSFIDGALEQGFLNAQAVADELRHMKLPTSVM